MKILEIFAICGTHYMYMYIKVYYKTGGSTLLQEEIMIYPARKISRFTIKASWPINYHKLEVENVSNLYMPGIM